MDKRFYKVISLFIKAVLLIASFYYIIYKLTTPDALASYHSIIFSNETIILLLFCFILMFVNWSLEAVKWKLLIAPYEEITWLQSIQSIFAGVTISIFTPNRIGEFTGRIFFLKKADRLMASIRSIVGSFLQLSVTMIAGIIGIWVYIEKGYNSRTPLFAIIDQQQKFMLLLILSSTCVVTLIMIRLSFFAKLKYQMKEIFNIRKSELLRAFLLSILRYAIFTFQYYLLVLALGVEVEPIPACMLITIIFFINSVIPSFALTEIVVRSAVAVYVFSILEPAQPVLIASASLLLWIINLAVPALIGSSFIGKFQIFKTH